MKQRFRYVGRISPHQHCDDDITDQTRDEWDACDELDAWLVSFAWPSLRERVENGDCDE